MRTLLIILFVFISGITKSQDLNQRLDKFNDFIGYEKAVVLDSVVYSFELFLRDNFGEFDNPEKRIKKFLKYINDNDNQFNTNWILPIELNKKIIKSYENSGLRKEIRLRSNEKYNSNHDVSDMWCYFNKSFCDTTDKDTVITEPIEEEIIPITRNGEVLTLDQDYLDFNIFGKYLYGLWKYNQDNKFINDYVQTKMIAGDISLSLTIDSFLYFLKPKDYKNPFIKRIIAIEIYLYLMY